MDTLGYAMGVYGTAVREVPRIQRESLVVEIFVVFVRSLAFVKAWGTRGTDREHLGLRLVAGEKTGHPISRRAS